MKKYLLIVAFFTSSLTQAGEIILSCQTMADIGGIKGRKVTEYVYKFSADGRQVTVAHTGKTYPLKVTDMTYEWVLYTHPNGADLKEVINRVTGGYEQYVGDQLVGTGSCSKATTKF